MPINVLLLQARDPDDKTGGEERESFARKAGLPVERMVPHDLLSGPPTMAKVRQFDALMIGGSGDYYVSKQNLPHFAALLDLLIEVVDKGHPTLASCFGFQLLVKALGGDVVYDAENMEVGTYDLMLTPPGRQDELLGCLPKQFRAQLGHKDRAVELPAACTHLASSTRSPFQAMRIDAKPIWATQFHPELTVEENRERFRQYVDGYAVHLSKEEREQALSRFTPSPETHGLIRRFLDIVFG
jgi:GMP synthase (glutamine-hydrolysing)